MPIRPYCLAVIAGLLLTGCRSQPGSPQEIADVAMESMKVRVGEVVPEQTRSQAIQADFNRLQGLFLEFREIQIQHRKRVGQLLRDYDSTEAEILQQMDDYNHLKEQKVREAQALQEKIDATLEEAERKAMEPAIRQVMESLLNLASAP